MCVRHGGVRLYYLKDYETPRGLLLLCGAVCVQRWDNGTGQTRLPTNNIRYS